MKKLFSLFLAMVFFPMMMVGAPDESRDCLREKYHAFENERGNKAYLAAKDIMDLLGEEVKFDADCDKDVMKSQVLRTLIFHYYDKGEFTEVLAYARIAEQLYRAQNNLMDQAGCYHTMAVAYQYLGNYEEAIRYYNQCNDIMDEIGGPQAMTSKRYEINNIAAIYLAMEECDLSEEMYWKCIDLLGEVGTDTVANRDLAAYYNNLAGVMLFRLSKMDADAPERDSIVKEAVDYAERGLDITRRYGDKPDYLVNRMINVSKSYFEAGRFDEANAMADSAMVIIQDLDLHYYATATHLLRGNYAYQLGHFAEAEKHYIKALELAEEYRYDEFRVESLHGAYLSTKKNHPEKSIEYLEQCKVWEDSIYNHEQQALIRDYQVKYQTAEKERELLLQQSKNVQNRHKIVWLLFVSLLLIVLIVVLLYFGMLRRKQNEMLKRRNKIKDHLFSVVSHDIKAPVEAQAQLLDLTCAHYDVMPPDEVKESLRALYTSTKELKDKMSNVIFWVKGELGETEPHRSIFNLKDMAQETVIDLQAQADMKRLTIVNEIPADWQGFDDVTILKMVLRNLLTNAMKFSWDGGEIKLSAWEEGKRYWISVTDHGVGIAKDKLDTLLKEMASSSKGTKGEMGTGIGLFVSRQMMDRIGGEICIESIDNQGTIVSFSVNKA